jgi:hypothetical protein
LSIEVRGYVVPNSEEVIFLELPLHTALKWKQWVAETTRKTSGATDILNWLRHTRWAVDPLLLLLCLYKSLVRARTEYGSFLIHGLSNSQKVIIEKIQLKALKRALRLRSSAPANIVLWEAKIPPL